MSQFVVSLLCCGRSHAKSYKIRTGASQKLKFAGYELPHSSKRLLDFAVALPNGASQKCKFIRSGSLP
ncbi:hypothetical protein CKA32_002515 [Geitlerinema sp. FC II]|nr:hypothetical protein CKA32_002515 [Geitlerinema sp. FC II]